MYVIYDLRYYKTKFSWMIFILFCHEWFISKVYHCNGNSREKNSDREIKKESCENEGKREYGRERERMRVSPRVEVRDRSLLPRSTSSTWYLLLGKRGGEEGEELRGVVPTTGKERGRGGRRRREGSCWRVTGNTPSSLPYNAEDGRKKTGSYIFSNDKLFYIGSKTNFSKSDPTRLFHFPPTNHSPPPQPITAHDKFKILAWPTLTPFFIILYTNDNRVVFSHPDPSLLLLPPLPLSFPGLDTSFFDNEWSRADSLFPSLSRLALSLSFFPSHSRQFNPNWYRFNYEYWRTDASWFMSNDRLLWVNCGP